MHSNVTIKNVSWPHFSWATLYMLPHYLAKLNMPLNMPHVENGHMCVESLHKSEPAVYACMKTGGQISRLKMGVSWPPDPMFTRCIILEYLFLFPTVQNL